MNDRKDFSKSQREFRSTAMTWPPPREPGEPELQLFGHAHSHSKPTHHFRSETCGPACLSGKRMHVHRTARSLAATLRENFAPERSGLPWVAASERPTSPASVIEAELDEEEVA